MTAPTAQQLANLRATIEDTRKAMEAMPSTTDPKDHLLYSAYSALVHGGTLLFAELDRREREHAEEIDPYVCIRCSGDGIIGESGLDPMSGMPATTHPEGCPDCKGRGLVPAHASAEEIMREKREGFEVGALVMWTVLDNKGLADFPDGDAVEAWLSRRKEYRTKHETFRRPR